MCIRDRCRISRPRRGAGQEGVLRREGERGARPWSRWRCHQFPPPPPLERGTRHPSGRQNGASRPVSSRKETDFPAPGSRTPRCAPGSKSEKAPRSRHRCKHTRVDLQTRAWVQVYPTQWSRDLDPKEVFSLVLRACLGDLQKGWSNSSSSVYILIWGLQGN